MPPDSSWNTPIVSPRLRSSKVGWSSSGTVLDREIRRVLADVLHGFVDDGEVLQPEEVHLEQADLGDGAHVILGDDFAFVAAGERDVFVERAVADDDAGGVDADVAVEAFEFERRSSRVPDRWTRLSMSSLQLGLRFHTRP